MKTSLVEKLEHSLSWPPKTSPETKREFYPAGSREKVEMVPKIREPKRNPVPKIKGLIHKGSGLYQFMVPGDRLNATIKEELFPAKSFLHAANPGLVTMAIDSW